MLPARPPGGMAGAGAAFLAVRSTTTFRLSAVRPDWEPSHLGAETVGVVEAELTEPGVVGFKNTDYRHGNLPHRTL